VLDDFLARYVRKQGLRSADEIERTFRVYVRPRLGDKPIYELQRRDVVELLDAIEDNHGPVMADRALAYLRKAFNWQATRDDDFNPPFVKGMARTKARERARTGFSTTRKFGTFGKRWARRRSRSVTPVSCARCC